MSLLIRNFTKSKVDSGLFEEVFDSFLGCEKIKSDSEVSLVFVGEKRIKYLNKKYRGIDKITDVLSFEGDYESSDGVVDFLYLGEIFICSRKAKKQALSNKHSLKKEEVILFVHGLYHLLGYDHISDEEYLVMKKKEDNFNKSISYLL